MEVTIKDNKLYIEIDLETPTPSSSGKTLVVASSHGNMVTSATIDGKIAVGTTLSSGPRTDPSVRNYRTGLLP